MAIGSKEQASRIVPNQDGSGNDVFLKTLPEFKVGDKATKVHFIFVDETEAEYDHGHFDPFGADTEKRKDAGLARLLHLYGALMSRSAYTKLKEYDESNDSTIEAFVEYANTLLDESIFDEPLKILVAYNAQNYLTMPAYGDVISSKYKPKTLMWTVATKTTLKPIEKKMDNEMAGGGSGNDM